MVSNGTKTTAQEMDAMRAAAASPRPKTDPEVGSGETAGDYNIIAEMKKAMAAPNTEAALLAAADAEPRTFVGNELHNVEVTRCNERGCNESAMCRVSHAGSGWAAMYCKAHATAMAADGCRVANLSGESEVRSGNWSNVRPVTAPEQAEFDETLDAFGIGNPQAGEGAPLAPSPAPLDRETADAFFRAGYSAAMCEAVVIVHKHFISSMARGGATIDLCDKGGNPPSSKGAVPNG